MVTSTKEMDMELTILMLVGIAFFAGVIGGLVVAESMELPSERKDRVRRESREARKERFRRNVTFTIDKF